MVIVSFVSSSGRINELQPLLTADVVLANDTFRFPLLSERFDDSHNRCRFAEDDLVFQTGLPPD